MFRLILKKLKFWLFASSRPEGPEDEQPVRARLDESLKDVQETLGKNPDVVTRQFLIGPGKGVKAALVYIDGLIDKVTVNQGVLRPLMVESRTETGTGLRRQNALAFVESHLLAAGQASRSHSVNDLVSSVLSGDTVLLVDGANEALVVSTRGWEHRAIEEAESEVVVRGPHQAFLETLRFNTALLRRIIRHPALTFDMLRLGRRTRTDVCVVYLKHLVNPHLIVEIKRRLRRIDVDSILGAGYIEEYIEDAPFSPFATVGYTERPDVVAGKLLEGRAAILIDGTPYVLTVPFLFIEALQSAEDYHNRYTVASLTRTFRFVGYAISILGPSIYVALATFHQELIPTSLLISLAASSAGIPLPAVVEAILMGFVFELLQEAGLRLPRPYGQAVSIVGALVIGQATATAGFVSQAIVIVVAITAIASFVTPQRQESPIIRLLLTVLAGTFGAFGIMIGLLGVLVHLAGLRSFGVPYLSPIAPFMPQEMKDVAARAPYWAMIYRPRSISWQDPQRVAFRLEPHPPDVSPAADKGGQEAK